MEADEELATYMAEVVSDRLEVRDLREVIGAARLCKIERLDALIHVMKKFR